MPDPVPPKPFDSSSLDRALAEGLAADPAAPYTPWSPTPSPAPFVPLQIPPELEDSYVPPKRSPGTPVDTAALDRAIAEGLAYPVGDPTDQEATPQSQGIGGTIRDVIDATNSGIGTAVHETAKAAVQFVGTGVRLGEKLTNKVIGSDYNLTSEIFQPVLDWEQRQRLADGSTFEPKTIAGQVTKGGAQFVTAFVGAGKILKAEQAFNSLNTGGQMILQGVAADSLAFDPHQPRLSNLVRDLTENHPSLYDPITTFLAAKDTDTDSDGRLKNAVEGVMLGKVVDSVLIALRATRQALRAKPGEAKAIIEKATGDLEAEHAKATPEANAAGEPDGVATAPVSPESAPLLSPEGVKDLFLRIKDNPDWLTTGSVNKGRDFNFSNWEGPDGAKLAIDELSQIIAPEIEAAKGGIQPLRKIEDMADILGTDPDQLMMSLSSQAKEVPQQAARMVAGEQLLQSISRRVSDLARQLNGGHATQEIQAEFVKMANRMADLQTNLKAVKTGAARTTAAGRIRTRDSFSDADIRALASADGNVRTVAMLTREKSLGTKLFDAALSYRYNAMLSNPVTHARNMIGSALQTFIMPIERSIGGALTGQRDVMKEGAHIALSVDGAVWDSLKMAYKSLKTGDSVLDPFVSKIETPRYAISAQALDISNPTMAGFVDAVGKFSGIPTRFLQAEDEFFKQLNFRAQVTADATQAGIQKNLEGPALAQFIEAERRKAFSASGEGLNPKALNYANVATFTNKPLPGGWTEGIEQFAGKHPATRLFIPFIRTPSNILKGLWFRTPLLAPLSREFRSDIAAGGVKRADAVGRLATGALLWTAGMSLALKGKITGSGPSDPRQRQALLQTGWKPYSFRVGDDFTSYNGIDPVAMFLGLSADIAEAGNHAKKEDFENVACAATMAMAKNLSSKTYLQGLSEALLAFDQPDRSMKRYLDNQVASVVPSGLKKLASVFPGGEDPYMREVRSAADALRNKIPGLSKDLPPKRNIFGEPITIAGALGPDLISPFYSSTLTADPAALELARLDTGLGDPATKVGSIDLTQIKNAKNQDAYDRWQELMMSTQRGSRTLKDALAHLVTSERYAKWKSAENTADEAGKAPRTVLEVQALVHEYRATAFQKMLKEFPELGAVIQAQKRAGTRASAGVPVPRDVLDFINQLSP